MLVTSGTGEVRKCFSGTGSFTYPVGKTNLTTEYLPVTLNFISGDFTAGNFVGLRLINTAFTGFTSNCLNRYWTLTQNGISGFLCDAAFQYSTEDIIGNETHLSCMQVNPSPLTAFSPVNLALHQLSANGISKFGDFTGLSMIRSDNKVFLEASFNSSVNQVLTRLRDSGRIPLSQPFNIAPFNYTGTESSASVPADIVDWVLVELRQATSPELATKSAVIGKRAAFLRSNGSIVDMDGTSPVQFFNASVDTGNNVYTVIRHRNHLAIMSSAGASFTGNNFAYDFTTGLAKAMGGGNGYKQLGSGNTAKYAMVAGDIDQDGNVYVSDYNSWAVLFGTVNGYLPTDLDMDGNVYVSDYNTWAVNFGSTDNSLLKSAQIKSKFISGVPE
jgi:hypothetical protein